ncbi:OmpA family protein [Thalassovita taeanensis]|uniref:OmpA-OmpF porin, OOP family n=1 Tax=Thalassovita taeanensis TaxID=657014 RepID=A0A1H9AU55_9RHOB|nr:OmpA family protein [Thalassovita taeanensis]SEP80296.1 OmpA-OmpF porin, OOP family [Thalassovita taeanensis]
MRLSSIVITAVTFALAAGLSLITAGFAGNVIEDNSEYSVRQALDDNAMHWAEVHADGLQVFLTGTAPSEAVRFKALSVTGGIVDAARVIDQMTVQDSALIEPPRFSVEILRNDSGVSLIGLVPAATDRQALVRQITALANEGQVSDLLQTADYPVPEGWDEALGFALKALKTLPRSKISASAGEVVITAMSDSPTEKRRMETELSRAVPSDTRMMLDISAPRPVITPFTLRFLIDEAGARFDACSADDDEARRRILAAAVSAGLSDKASCTIGLGVPSPKWGTAVERAIVALKELGAGSVTFADADITLVAAEGTDQALFDRVVGELENNLPTVFALHPVLPKPERTSEQGTPEFVATLSPEGLVQLRGRLNDELTRSASESFAHARFGTKSVHTAARLDDTLPKSWPLRVLTGIDALSRLSNGALNVTPDLITVSGNTGNPDASAEIARLMVDKLGDAERFELNVTYLEKLDPIASIPTPDECEAQIAEILSTRKINFEPGSDTPDSEARVVIDDIADILKLCGEVRMEISGHTDSQGREEMNQQLSQARAQAVLNALRERRVPTNALNATGYGEADPVAGNDTEEGREANRRIEFRLIRPKVTRETETTLESAEQTSEEGADIAAEEVINPADAASEEGSNDE